MKNIGRILKYLVPYWQRVSLNVFFNILSVIFGLFSVAVVIPFLGIIFNNQEIVTDPGKFSLSAESVTTHFQYYLSNIKINHGAEKALLFVGATIILMTFLKTFFKYIAMYNLAPIRNGIPRDIRNKTYDKVLRLPLSFYSNEKKGDIMSRMTSDVQEVEWSLVSSIEMIIRDPLTIIIYLSTLFYMSVELTLFVIILLPVSGIIIGRIGKSLKKTSMKGQKKMGTLLSILEETLSGLRIVKAFNAEEKVSTKFKDTNSIYTRLMIKMFRRRYLANPLSEFLGTAVMVIIMWYGGSIVLSESGNLSSQEFIAYLMLFFLIIEPSKSFSSAYYNIQKGLASADRIDLILNAKETIINKKDSKEIKDFNSAIEYNNVSFKYETDEVLKNINLSIEKGKTIALVGQSGSGKSTLADLLPRFYDVTKGDIYIDGTSLKDLKIKDLRSLMGIVNQEPILFNDNFFNNIAFGVDNATEDEVIAAAKVANAHEFIMDTPNGYYTNIGDRGSKLSGGQRQRISIARAVLKNPPILILDEATSALDTESERLVQDALTKLMNNRTSLVIAHRLSTVQDADEICVMHEGEIVERGKHNDLLELKGIYRKLHDLQIFSK